MRTELDIGNDWHEAPGRAETHAVHSTYVRELREAIPEVYAGFGAMHDAAVRTGALDRRMKELIALAVAVVQGCDRCIDIHARAAAGQDASGAEVAEALGVAILMAGGPGTSYAPVAWAAYRRATEE